MRTFALLYLTRIYIADYNKCPEQLKFLDPEELTVFDHHP